MQLQLDAHEYDVLSDTLAVAISELHSEIAHTDSRDYRETLRHRLSVLRQLAHRLDMAQAEGKPAVH